MRYPCLSEILNHSQRWACTGYRCNVTWRVCQWKASQWQSRHEKFIHLGLIYVHSMAVSVFHSRREQISVAIESAQQMVLFFQKEMSRRDAKVDSSLSIWYSCNPIFFFLCLDKSKLTYLLPIYIFYWPRIHDCWLMITRKRNKLNVNNFNRKKNWRRKIRW